MSNSSFPPENEGLLKPLALGLCFYAPAVLVQTADLVYQLHNGAYEKLFELRDNGVSLTFSGTPSASTSTTVDLPAGAINVSNYYKGARIRLSDGTTEVERTVAAYTAATRRITLSSSIAITPNYFSVDLWRVSDATKSQVMLFAPPAGKVTAVIHGEVGAASSENALLAELVSYIGQTYGGLSGGDIITDLTSLRAGIYLSDERPLGAVLTELLGGLKSWWGFDRATAKLAAKKLVFPTSPPSKALDLTQAFGWDWEELEQNLYRLTVHYRRNLSVIQDPPGGVDPATAELLRQAHLAYTKTLASPKSYQGEAVYDTWLTSVDATYGAQAFADAAVTELNTQRHWVTADIPWRGETWDLGDPVNVTGGNAKANGYKLVMGVDMNVAARRVRLTLLG